MSAVLRGVAALSLFLGKSVLVVGHVVFSSVYQNTIVVAKQLQDDLQELRENHDDIQF